MGVRTNGQIGSADSLGKTDEKLKSENVQKRGVFYSDIPQNALFRSQIFEINSPQAARGR